MLQDFTTPDEIRAVLGVAESELTDDVIDLPLYERLLSMDLREIALDLATDYLALPDAGSRTSAEQLFFDCVQVYSAYAVAYVLVQNEAMFAPEVITDSKTTLQRANPYIEAKASVTAGYGLMRGRLIAAYSATGPTVSASVATPLIGMVAVGGASDPVTGT